MTVTVFVWEPTDQQVGHAALGVQGAAGAAHISWWPVDGEKNSALWPEKYTKGYTSGMLKSVVWGVSGRRYTLNLDEDGEGKSAEHLIPLQKLNEAAIIKWWDKEFAIRDWSLLNSNCAQIVADALRVGGAKDLLHGVQPWMTSWATVWTPLKVLAFARAVRASEMAPTP